MTGLKATVIYVVFVRVCRRQKSEVGSIGLRCCGSDNSDHISAPRKL